MLNFRQDEKRRQNLLVKSTSPSAIADDEASIRGISKIYEESKFHHSGSEHERRVNSPIINNVFRLGSNKGTSKCDKNYVINLAIEYDSYYCISENKKEVINSSIRDVIDEVSNIFQKQHICLQFKISYLNGYCNPDTDPLRSVVDETEKSLRLKKFRHYWNKNKAFVNRTITFLFSGNPMRHGFNGIAYKNATCMKSYAFGAIAVKTRNGFDSSSIVIAHEIGHILGASHYDKKGSYIMNEFIGDGRKGFHQSTLETIQNILVHQECLSIEDNIEPYSDYSGELEIFFILLVLLVFTLSIGKNIRKKKASQNAVQITL